MDRFIPAHAGNRQPRKMSGISTSVHPRACGEQENGTADGGDNVGSSPRMRGTGSRANKRVHSFRFIPAHAGNSLVDVVGLCVKGVHPRACGEQLTAISAAPAITGSSPRMRGTGWRGARGRHGLRFIPAHAGNSLGINRRERLTTVHPRACGEQVMGSITCPECTGSSPRMRGTGSGVGGLAVSPRFIPAHAGNSPPRRCGRPAGPVHPRACGEQPGRPSAGPSGDGSSPRMRGTEGARPKEAYASRFIPAHAGNRPTETDPNQQGTVHPRACGEQARCRQ